jgi:sulfur relay (sulfurtransferase) DsrC/TusE family protein
MDKGLDFLVFIISVFVALMCFLFYKAETQQQEEQNSNKYIRKFWPQYIIVVPILILIKDTVQQKGSTIVCNGYQ